MSSRWISYFGFGSLVNRDTRPGNEEAINATLTGWRRVWNHRVHAAEGDRHCTSLSIEPCAGAIEGVLVSIPANQLAVLDQRESGYQRLSVARSDFLLSAGFETSTETDTIYVYQSLSANQHLADDSHPILQSYVDCVMAGYQRRFGEEGLQRMLQSTGGWNRPVLNDRQAPRYPRSVDIPQEQLQRFDTLLAQLR